MKKFLIILGMLTCLLGMTACTQNQEDAAVANPLQIDDESALAYAQQVIDAINQIVVAGLEEVLGAHDRAVDLARALGYLRAV